MILGHQEAHKVLPLVTSLDAYAAFQVLIGILYNKSYAELKDGDAQRAIGKLILLDELKELRERLKDSLKNDRPTTDSPISF